MAGLAIFEVILMHVVVMSMARLVVSSPITSFSNGTYYVKVWNFCDSDVSLQCYKGSDHSHPLVQVLITSHNSYGLDIESNDANLKGDATCFPPLYWCSATWNIVHHQRLAILGGPHLKKCAKFVNWKIFGDGLHVNQFDSVVGSWSGTKLFRKWETVYMELDPDS